MTDKPLVMNRVPAARQAGGSASSRRTSRGEAPAEAGVRYADDPYSWALAQCALLESGRFDLLDIENLVDEVGDVARREDDKLRSAVEVTLVHLLKWDHQPERRGRSWALSVAEHRERAERQLRENPGLKPRRDEAVADAYRLARLVAARETGLPRESFPDTCPYDWDAVMTREIALGGD